MPRLMATLIAVVIVGGCSSLQESADMRECMAGANSSGLTEFEQREACQCALDKTRHIDMERATPEELLEVFNAGIECGQDVIRKRQK